jgi:hypothetical protein
MQLEDIRFLFWVDDLGEEGVRGFQQRSSCGTSNEYQTMTRHSVRSSYCVRRTDGCSSKQEEPQDPPKKKTVGRHRRLRIMVGGLPRLFGQRR